MAADAPVIEHPNREKAANKATKAVVVLLLLASAVLVFIVTIGGWNALEGAKVVGLVYGGVFVLLAYYVWRWSRGALPVSAALAIIMLIFAAVSGPGWFNRDKTGFTNPAIPSSALGLITLLIIPVEAVLIAFAMRGFSQAWNVEVERYSDGTSNAAPAGA
jgi:protein-S-isoprenylcysteine O-methyltransferase Ste14